MPNELEPLCWRLPDCASGVHGEREAISEGHRPWLQRALDCEEFIANLLAIEVLDNVVCQPNILVLAEGIALRMQTHDVCCLIWRGVHLFLQTWEQNTLMQSSNPVQCSVHMH